MCHIMQQFATNRGVLVSCGKIRSPLVRIQATKTLNMTTTKKCYAYVGLNYYQKKRMEDNQTLMDVKNTNID